MVTTVLLQPSIPIGWRLRLLRHATNASASQWEYSIEAVATMIGCLPTQAIAFE